MNQTKIEKDLRFLKIYALGMTLVCLLLFGIIFKSLNKTKFSEIDAERINIVESDGRLRMVMSNKMRQHPGAMDGVTFSSRNGERPPGLLFFGESGNEIGGLVFNGDAGKSQGGSLTFDKLRGDQTIQFIHEEDTPDHYFAGLKMNDQNMPLTEMLKRDAEISKLSTKEARDAAYKELQSKGLLMTERLKLGRDFDKSSTLELKDAKGKVRLVLKVEANGNPRINFFDEFGKMTFSLPK